LEKVNQKGIGGGRYLAVKQNLGKRCAPVSCLKKEPLLEATVLREKAEKSFAQRKKNPIRRTAGRILEGNGKKKQIEGCTDGPKKNQKHRGGGLAQVKKKHEKGEGT